jgi:hypothetical protein
MLPFAGQRAGKSANRLACHGRTIQDDWAAGGLVYQQAVDLAKHEWDEAAVKTFEATAAMTVRDKGVDFAVLRSVISLRGNEVTHYLVALILQL